MLSVLSCAGTICVRAYASFAAFGDAQCLFLLLFVFGVFFHRSLTWALELRFSGCGCPNR